MAGFDLCPLVSDFWVLEQAFALALAEAQRTHSRVLGTPHLCQYGIGPGKLDGVASGLRAKFRQNRIRLG
jgi:hypothetical protein